MERSRALQLLGVFLAGVIVTAAGLTLSKRVTPAPIVITPANFSSESGPATETPLRVYVTGAVVSPDVYELPPGSIVQQAVEAAGGFTEAADPVSINLAQSVCDGCQVHVPELGESDESQPAGVVGPARTSTPSGEGALININQASAAELESLPGIGPALASRICEYRESFGPFQALEDIKNVPGIGDAKFAALKEFVTLR